MKHIPCWARTALALLAILLLAPRPWAQEGPRPAILIVRVAPDARLTVDGAATTLTGALRRFQSAPLPAGRYSYKFQATWNEAGQETQTARQVFFQAGETVEVDLRTSDRPPTTQKRSIAFPPVDPVEVGRGQSQSFTIRIRRSGFDEPVKLTIWPAIRGVAFDVADIPAGMESAKVFVSAEKSATLGNYRVSFWATAGQLSQFSTEFRVNVTDPPIVAAWKRAGAEAGWLGVRFFGGGREFVGENEGKPGDLPVFRFTDWQPGRLAKLPAPTSAFGLELDGSQITDAGLKELSGLKNLQWLNLYNTKVTDAGLKELAGLKLKTLWLPISAKTDLGLKHYLTAIEPPTTLVLFDGPFGDFLTGGGPGGWKVTDAGLKELAGLKSLKGLYLMQAQVTDVGLKELAGLKLKTLEVPNAAKTDLGLKHYLAAIEPPTMLSLGEWKVTDAGLKELAGLQSLQSLNLSGTKVADAGLKELAGLRSLQALYLSETQVTGAGLKYLAGLKNLQTLSLHNTRGVTDAGLKELAGLRSLQSLFLSETKVTDAGLKELAGLKSLQTLTLHNTREVTDAGLKELAGLKSLQSLYLSGTKVTDAGLKELAGLKLIKLDLPESANTDFGLKHYLAAVEPPTMLFLAGWQLTDAGLKDLAGLQSLQSLDLSHTQVTDAGLKDLAGLKSLQKLSLWNTKVTDAGLKDLAGLPNLQTLNLFATLATDAGVARLRRALPGCQISFRDLNGGR